MASTIKLSRTINTSSRFVNQAPLVFTGTNDPAFTIADWVRGFILSPPFAWRWNRGVVPAITVQPFSQSTQAPPVGGQDYTVNLPNFGWLEQAVLIDNTASPPQAHQLEVALNLGEENTNNQPTKIAARLDDGNGNITFRLQPPPDKVYSLNITYQLAAPIFKHIDDTWAPIPDFLHFLVHGGMIAKAYEYSGDERFPAALQLFVRQVVATNGGLDQSMVNIFMADQINSAVEQQSASQKSQAANQGRFLG